MLLYRILTTILGLPLLLYTAYIGGLPFLLITALVVFTGLFEFYKALESSGYNAQKSMGVLISLFFLSVTYFNINHNFFELYPYLYYSIFFLILISLLIVYVILYPQKKPLKNTGITILGSIYTGGFLSFLILLRTLFSAQAVYVVFLSTWSYDTFAYFIGKKWGRRKFMTHISPNKTLEGAFGGGLGSIVSMIIFSLLTDMSLHLALIIGFVSFIITPFGDLTASMFKREMKIKDFSSILPGHGGMLDRFDGIIFMAPIIYLILLLYSSVL